MRRRAPALVPALALIGAVACGEVYADPIGSSSGGSTGIGASGTDSGLTAPSIPRTPCDADEVSENAPCVNAGDVCEYGSSPDPSCNRAYTCEQDPTYGNYWTEQPEKSCPFSCPDPSTIVDGAPCDLSAFGDGGAAPEDELQCATPNGVCACTTGPDGAHAHPRRWVCVKPAADCPPSRPRLGQICVGDHECDYGACAFKRGARMICEDGTTWQIEAAPCE